MSTPNAVQSGKIVQISGPVVDVRFESDTLPNLYDALVAHTDDREFVMEVAHHIGSHTVRCIMLNASEGLSKDVPVETVGGGIRVPVGNATLGRLFNVLGQTIDNGDPVPEEKTFDFAALFAKIMKLASDVLFFFFGGKGFSEF